jgi:hypothetical protein
MKIVTHFVYPPIPIRSMDWSAVTDDYDAELVDGEWTSSHPVGRGATEQAAIDDLNQQLEDRE